MVFPFVCDPAGRPSAYCAAKTPCDRETHRARIVGAVERGGSTLHSVTGWVGALVSGSFLYAIAALNAVILLGIVGVLREMRRGPYDERAAD
jgi:hypothetical protein